MRGRFLWRAALLFSLFLLALFMVFGTVGWLAAHRFGRPPLFEGPPPFFRPFGFLVALLVVFGVLSAIRAFRGTAAPVGDVMEAAGRLAGGNYAVRVRERGPADIRALARAFNEMAARLQMHEAHRRNLLADVTHELRTPLAVIQGNLEGLLDGVYPRDNEHLVPVLEEARVLSTLIEDLRTLALAETGTLPLHREVTDLAALVDDAAGAFGPQAEAAGVSLSTSVPELPPMQLDPTRIRQVLTNLLSNALRHTPAGGGIEVTARLDPSGERVVISVVDSGRGIPPDELPHIFDRFYKSKDSRGSGLGLTIARNLVALHGGEIHAESTPGTGTTIRMMLPIRSA